MLNSKVKHYKILRKLGSGGMGVVYLAKDTILDRDVALKFLPQYIANNETERKRFYNEARAVSKLQHNNICTIHEIDENDDGQMFICMDYYEGNTLKYLIKNKKISQEESLKIIIQVAEGIRAAHEKNIIHRDLKPENIFITKENVVKILDFGLVKHDNQTQLTKAGNYPGTISYMSPEQSMGDEVDDKTDLWSIGVIFYEMLCGQRPFKGEYDQAIIYSILNEEPQNIQEINQNVYDELERILSKLLCKNKENRYQSSQDLIIDLKKAAGIKTSNLQYYLHEKKKLILVSFFIIFFVCTLLLILILFPRSSSANDTIAIMTFENQTNDTSYNYLRIAVPNLLITNLGQSKLFSVTTWERLNDLLKQAGESDINNISKEIGFKLCQMENVNIIALGSITKAGNYFVTDVKLLDVNSKKLLNSVSAKGEGIESILSSQIDEISKSILASITDSEEAEKSLPKTTIELTTNSIEAYNYYLRGNDNFGTLDWRLGVRNFSKAIEIDSNFAMAYNNLSVCYSYLNRFDEMKDAIERAVLLSEKISKKEKQFIKGQYEILINKDYQEAFKIYDKLADEFPKDKRILLYKAFCLRHFDNADEFIKTHKLILQLDPTFGNSLNAVGYQYLLNNKFDSAKIYFDKQLEAYPYSANSFDALGDYYLLAGDLNSAEVYYVKAINIDEDFLSVRIKIAYLSALNENFNEAQNILQEDFDNKSKYEKIITFTWQAYFQFLTKNYLEAFKLLDQARELEVENNLANRLTYNYFLTSWFYLQKNDFTNSEKYFDKYLSTSNYTLRNEIDSLLFNCYKNLKQNNLSGMLERISKISKLISNLTGVQKRIHEPRINKMFNILISEHLLALKNPMEAFNNNKLFSSQYSLNFNEMMIIENLPFERDIRARCFIKMDMINEAIKEYENLIYRKKSLYKNSINDPIYHYRLAKLYEQENLFSKALHEYKVFTNICSDGDIKDSIIIDSKNKIDLLLKLVENKNE